MSDIDEKIIKWGKKKTPFQWAYVIMIVFFTTLLVSNFLASVNTYKNVNEVCENMGMILVLENNKPICMDETEFLIKTSSSKNPFYQEKPLNVSSVNVTS